MKLSVSNIAWSKHDDADVLDLLRSEQVSGIEIAPTKIWPGWEGVNKQSVDSYRSFLEGEGFVVPALQAILYGKPELQVFDPNSHHDFLEHFALVADLAVDLGAKVLVFGSPKNRRRGQLAPTEAMKRAINFFRLAGDVCSRAGCCLAIEHNPVEYGADFGTNVAEVIELVKGCGHDAVKLHLDSGGLYLCGSENSVSLRNVAPLSVHYHASEPMLAPLANGVIDHAKLIKELMAADFQGWVSIEMCEPKHGGFNVLRESISVIRKILQVF